MGAGGPEAVVVGERRAVAPGEAVGGCRGGDRGGDVLRCDLDLGQHVARVGVEERIGAALGGVPNGVEVFAGARCVASTMVQCGERGQSRKFLFHVVDGPSNASGRGADARRRGPNR